MAQINAKSLARYPVSTVASYGKLIETKIDSINLDRTNFKPHYEAFISSLGDLEDCILRINYNTVIRQLNIIAKKRSKVRTSIYYIFISYLNHKDETVRNAAENLKLLSALLVEIRTKSFFQQTAMISEFISKAKSSAFSTNIEKLHLTEWIDYFNEINNEYSHLKNMRVEEKGTYNNTLKPTEAKALFINAHDVLVKRLNSLANVHGESQYIELFSYWNALIDELKIGLSLRFGAGKGGKTSGGTPNKPDPSSGPVEDDRPVIE